MSETSQGPGWWLASDGKWYPPEQAPTAQPPPAPPPMPPSAPQPSKGTGGKGCIYVLIAVAAVILLGVVGLVMALALWIDSGVDNAGDVFDEDSCAFLTNAEARDVLGGNPRVVELSGINEFLSVTVDNRVLEGASDCVVFSSGDAAIARAARYQGADANSVFDDERDVADGTSQDQGGGISLETQSYLKDQTVELGDEGFCTTADLMGASGVLVRQGDTLVYVSIGLDLQEGETPEVDLESGGFATDDEHCVKAQDLARKVLG